MSKTYKKVIFIYFYNVFLSPLTVSADAVAPHRGYWRWRNVLPSLLFLFYFFSFICPNGEMKTGG